MERKAGEVFNDGNDLIEVVPDNDCGGCYYKRDSCINSLRYDIAGVCSNRKSGGNVKFIKIGESKMDNKEELKRSLAEEEQRAKDSLANVEKMKKQLEELNKKEVEVSATGVYLNKISDNDYAYLGFDNEIFETRKFNQELETDLIRINNIFATREQAEQEALRREGQEFIRRCAMLWNKGNDWRKDSMKSQYHIYRNSQNPKGDLIVGSIACFSSGIVFFDTEKLAERCIAELKAKYNNEQLKIIFGVI